MFFTNCKKKKAVIEICLNATDTCLMQKNGILYFNKQLFSGKLHLLHENTTDTASIFSYLDGKEDGIWYKYYPDGKLKEKREFANGIKVGTFTTWWPNGNIQTHCLFSNNEYHGTSKEWTESGILVKEMNYYNGQEEGWQRWWHDNGKVRSNYIIKQGRRYGLLGTKHCINVSDSIFKN